MSNKRKLMPPLTERPNPPSEPPQLMTAFMASGELSADHDPSFWDRIGISKSLMVAGQPKAGRSWL